MATGAEQRAAGSHRQPEVTAADLGVMVNGHVTSLLEAMHAGQTEGLTQFLPFSSRFHRYSRRNQELIYEQCPQATQVAPWTKWHDEGYTVRHMDKTKGERGIRILVPIPPAGYKAPARAAAEAESEEQQEIAVVTTHFNVGTVFNVSHLIEADQQRVPQFFPSIYGDHQALHERIVRAIQAEGIDYSESVDTYSAQGYSAGGFIVVRPDQRCVPRPGAPRRSDRSGWRFPDQRAWLPSPPGHSSARWAVPGYWDRRGEQKQSRPVASAEPVAAFRARCPPSGLP